MTQTIDIDTGGTFTDGFFVRGGEVRTVKVPTTPHDLTVCFLQCIQAGAAAFGVAVEDLLHATEVIRFSSTIGTNTIIERDGTRIGLLVTAGSEGLAPGAGSDGKKALILPGMVTGLAEEVSAAGVVVRTPDAGEILEAGQALIDRGARCLLVALANSQANPANERRVRAVIKREYPRDYLGSVPVFLASDISPRPGERQRINTAVLNAYTHAKLARLLYQAGDDLRQRRYRGTLFIGHNNGTVARVAKTRAVQTYNSGPAAGLIGARAVGQMHAIGDLISIDMGGTSFDVGVVREGRMAYALEPEIEGFRCNLPMMGIQAYGIGGGSIAHPAGGAIEVGPRSAGALPGPACFALGGVEPTVTDANLVLGVLDPEYYLGGKVRIDPERARTAISTRLAAPLGMTVEEAARAIRRRADQTMGAAVGRARAEFGAATPPAIVAYGGAAGLHVCAVAEAAGLGTVILTPFAAVFSAFSSSLGDVGHLYYRALDLDLADAAAGAHVRATLAEIARIAARDTRGEGFDPGRITVELQLFVRPAGGARELMVAAGPEVFADGPEAACELARGALAHPGQTTMGGIRLAGIGYLARVAIPHYEAARAAPAALEAAVALKGARHVHLDGDPIEVPVYDHGRLGNGHVLRGPALVESPQSTILVARGWRLRIDASQHTVLETAARAS